MKLKITLTEPMLGTKPSNIDLFSDYVVSKAPDDDKRKDELETAEHVEAAGTTVFHRWNKDQRIPIIWDYQIRGFFKSACGALRQVDGTLSKKVTAFKSKIDQLIFVNPRQIPIMLPKGGRIQMIERSLRAETAQGPRVGLARSETVPDGSELEFEVICLAKKIGKGDDAIPSDELVQEWLNYGRLCGLGQWRNASWGRFTWDEHKFGTQVSEAIKA